MTMSFFGELRRRNVFKVGVLYIVSCWIILQVADLLFDAFELPPQWIRMVLAVLILGFPVVMALAWLYEMTPAGLKRTSDSESGSTTASLTGRKITILTGVLLVLAIAAVALDRLMPAIEPVSSAPTTDQSETMPTTIRTVQALGTQSRSPQLQYCPLQIEVPATTITTLSTAFMTTYSPNLHGSAHWL